MVKPAEDERLTILQSLFCGGIAGVLSRTLTSPLEVVKVLAQVGTPETRLGFVRSFGRIYQSEGLKAFWKGNGISCLRLVPYSAVQLAAFHKMLVSVLHYYLKLDSPTVKFLWWWTCLFCRPCWKIRLPQEISMVPTRWRQDQEVPLLQHF